MSGIPITLDQAVEALFSNAGGPNPKTLKLLKMALGNVLKDPSESKYRGLNCEKLIPKLAVDGLAPLYILKHAGFVAGETHYTLAPQADLKLVQQALAAVVSRELGVPIDPSSLEVGLGGAGGGRATASAPIGGTKTKGEVSAEEAAQELKRIQEAEVEFMRKKEARLKKQREEEEERERVRQIEEEERARKAAEEKEANEGKEEEAADGDTEMTPAKPDAMENLEGLADSELDDEMKKIIKNLNKERPGSAGGSSTKVGLVDTGGKQLKDMTSEEKMDWLQKSKDVNKKRKEQEAIQKEKDRHKSQASITRAALDLQEKREEYMMKAAVSAKKKEEKERREARKRIKEKIENAKRERKAKG